MKHLLCFLFLPLLPLAAADSWPGFRGPHGNGHADAANLPETWSETENVRWKTPVPHRGWSTPLVHGNQIWLTTATEDGHDFSALCLDRATGRVLHETKLFHADKPEPLGNDMNGYASPTGWLEDGRVFLHFGSYGTACLATDDFRVLWKRTDLPCRHYRGPGSSLFNWKDTIILTMDGVDVQYLCALDKATGATRWRTDRNTEFDDLGADGKPVDNGDYRKSYTTPMLVEVDGKPQIVSSSSKATVAYDPDSGREIWRTTYKGFSNASLPAVAGNLVAINTGHGKANLQAFRITAATTGDITGQLVWEQTKNIPTRSSPIVAGGLIFTTSDQGLIGAIDPADGSLLFSERTGGSISASPLFADGKLFFSTERGDTTVVKPDRTFTKTAVNRLDDGLMASPVAAGNCLYLRTRTHLYCIAKPE
ncbi:MAG: PQQ-binding-like beta-propeller repeat protein [Verrucomicrobiota bacterium]|jgi:outer membrane protein assembly factor BamB